LSKQFYTPYETQDLVRESSNSFRTFPDDGFVTYPSKDTTKMRTIMIIIIILPIKKRRCALYPQYPF